MSGMNWPSDELNRPEPKLTGKQRLKNALKIGFFFLDDLAVLLLIAYLVYRVAT